MKKAFLILFSLLLPCTHLFSCNGVLCHLCECNPSNYKGDHFLLAAHYYQCEDYKIALNYALQGAELGSINAMLILKEAYWHGNGTAKSQNEGLKWLFVASKLGSKRASHELQEIKISQKTKIDPKINWQNAEAEAVDWIDTHHYLFS